MIGNFIGGEERPARSGAMGPVFDPATGSEYGQFALSEAADVDDAVAEAERAYRETWGPLDTPARAEILLSVAAELEGAAVELVDIEVRDTGKPRWLVEEMDSRSLAAEIRNYAMLSTGVRDVAHSGQQDALGLTFHQPYGVVAVLLPWNFPLLVFAEKVSQIIAAGNCVVVKPSESTPASAVVAAALMERCGLPKGVINVVQGFGPEVGAALVEHPTVERVSFTGSTRTGQIVARACADRLKRVSLELSGRNPFIVCKDADPESAAAAAAFTSFFNSGQVCTSGSRILVHESIHDRFLDAFVTEASALRLGKPEDPFAQLGPIIDQAHYARTLDLVGSVERNGELLHQGGVPKDLSGWYVAPVVTAPMTSNHPLLRDEVFAPVATVNSFRNLDEAVDAANATPFGLSAFLWTEDLPTALHGIGNLRAGRVWVNTAHTIPPDMTLPPHKMSGTGVEGGLEGLRSFTRATTAHIAYAASTPRFPQPSDTSGGGLDRVEQ